MSRAVYIVGASRTAFGSFGGSLKSTSATDLAVAASKHALGAAGVDAGSVTSATLGMVSHSSADAPYAARHLALKAGAPIETPALSINRLCGSGFQSVATGAANLLLGDGLGGLGGGGASGSSSSSSSGPGVALCAGTESMSQCPYAVRDIRWGTKFGAPLKMEDTLWDALTDTYAGVPMAITAENLADKYGITREECDAFAERSQRLWAAADAAGNFDAEIAPVEVAGKKRGEKVSFTRDEHPRPQSTLESLAKLPPVFKKDGVVTAGNASGICDGAGAIVLATGETVEALSLKPLARVAGWKVAGVDPSIMGIGPVPAIRGLLKDAGLTIDDIDLVEVNEAFAAQFLAVQKELGLDDAKVNTSGGAIALGHPLAASGSRILAHLAHGLHRTGGRYAIGSACIGGGQGIAVLLEKA